MVMRSISSHKLIIKFDHMDDPCPIEGKVLVIEELLCLPQTVSSHCCICCDDSQVSGIVP